MRFPLPVARDLCVGPPERQFLMGGVGLGCAIAALEQATERPLARGLHPPRRGRPGAARLRVSRLRPTAMSFAGTLVVIELDTEGGDR